MRPVTPRERGLELAREWMLPVETYAALHAAMRTRGVRLINSPHAYRATHHLPEWLAIFDGHTPRTVWTEGRGVELESLMPRLEVFAGAPLVVKDFVKSQKHRWAEACFIPSAADAAAVLRIASRFIELQGDAFTGGLVFREFVPLEPLVKHSKSDFPLTKELRVFVLDGHPLHATPTWSEGDYAGVDGSAIPPVLTDLARRVPSPFFTMDVAKTVDGRWIILELGDAQVAGLPDALRAADFYASLVGVRVR